MRTQNPVPTLAAALLQMCLLLPLTLRRTHFGTCKANVHFETQTSKMQA